jgi:hypothetical protein
LKINHVHLGVHEQRRLNIIALCDTKAVSFHIRYPPINLQVKPQMTSADCCVVTSGFEVISPETLQKFCHSSRRYTRERDPPQIRKYSWSFLLLLPRANTSTVSFILLGCVIVSNVTNGSKKLSLISPYDNTSQKNCHSVRTGDRQVPHAAGFARGGRTKRALLRRARGTGRTRGRRGRLGELMGSGGWDQQVM